MDTSQAYSRDRNIRGYLVMALNNREDYENAEGSDAAVIVGTSHKIGTKGKFSLMELPPELRLKIYPHLLCLDDQIIITHDRSIHSPKPCIAVLSTCRLINTEATPVLYNRNNFLIHLDKAPSPLYLPIFPKSYFPMSCRWSTIPLIKFLAYKASGSRTSQATFSCCGSDIMAQFTDDDIKYNPDGPGEYLALSISNWVSREVVKAELCMAQVFLAEVLRPDPALTALLAQDPASDG
ncbi:hypothetical protein B0O99DRAFT_686443 [Bisporella sp. PMI_857]|nr:hypothetical protein B0O99DRAFT_686443 [Bisporella sp. PMI_857]